MIEPSSLDSDTFRTLATGRGGRSAIGELRRAKLNENLLLLRHLVRASDGVPDVVEAFDVLARSQARTPAVVTDLLSLPWSGAWLAEGVRTLSRGDALPTVCAAYFVSLAAVAAARTGVDTELEMPAPGGADTRLMLPDTGSVALLDHDRPRVRISVRGGELIIGDSARLPARPDGTGGFGWWPLHRIAADDSAGRLTITLDDLDPYRDCHGRPVAQRLDASELGRWGSLVRQAWALLCHHAPQWSDEIRDGVDVLTPLSAESVRTGFSATSTDVFGGFALTRSGSPVAMACTLVHELQHSKLNVISRLHPLCTDNRTRFYVPWRPDPRPIEGLLHGVYAFFGVADLLRSLVTSTWVHRVTIREFAVLRQQVHFALGVARRSGFLTEAGETFVSALSIGVDDMLTTPVSRRILRHVRRNTIRTRLVWSVRNRSLSSTVAGPG